MSFKKYMTAKIEKRKKIAHHLERRQEGEFVKESLEDGKEIIQKSDDKPKK